MVKILDQNGGVSWSFRLTSNGNVASQFDDKTIEECLALLADKSADAPSAS